MPISVRALYEQICDCVLEPGELTGQTLTDAQFLAALNQVLTDFLQLGPYIKPLINQAELGVRIYESPGPSTVIKNLASDESGIPMNSGFYWDQSDAYWQNSEPGTPQEWRQDQLEEQGFEVRPAPAWNGWEIEVDTPGLYGQISDTHDSLGLEIECDPVATDGFLGTISECDYGDVYVDCAGAMYGTIAKMEISELNFTQFSICSTQYTVTSLDDYIPDIDKSFTPYLRMAIMRIVSENNAETKSVNSDRYYSARIMEGVQLVKAITEEKPE
jgi:hypothetical protein